MKAEDLVNELNELLRIGVDDKKGSIQALQGHLGWKILKIDIIRQYLKRFQKLDKALAKDAEFFGIRGELKMITWLFNHLKEIGG